MANEASLVFDNFSLNIPETMGTPTPEQCKGTHGDILGEIASRICYDSLGFDPVTGKARGRSSDLLHKHILDVRNHSVYEHLNPTVRFHNIDPEILLRVCANRKGIWLDVPNDDDDTVEITFNPRSVIEWDRHLRKINNTYHHAYVCYILRHHMHVLAPQIVRMPTTNHLDGHKLTWMRERVDLKPFDLLNEDQAWITLYLNGSRGWSHEQVRHRFAMSQRSTRYVDESESDYVIHPLIQSYLDYCDVSDGAKLETRAFIDAAIEADRACYRHLVERLMWYIDEHPNRPLGDLKGRDARKQARGAARGFLGNALFTEMLYSTNITGWRWILDQRSNPAADAEIRRLYEHALPELQRSQYGLSFADYSLAPSPDGLGQIITR